MSLTFERWWVLYSLGAVTHFLAHGENEILDFKRARRDSNPKPSDPKSGVLLRGL